MKICSVEGCGRKSIAKGLCSPHWQRARHGSVSAHRPIGVRPKGAEAGRWIGGRVRGAGDGRWMIYTPDYPGPKVSGVYVLEYRLVAEKKLGRYLRQDEIVHHINGDHDDNRPKNLEVMTQSEHAKLHNALKSRNEKGQFAN